MKGSDRNESWFVYMLECEGDRYYTGCTTDPVERFLAHLTGKKGARFTRSFKPVRIAACWEVPGGRGDALKFEYEIKSKSRKYKASLVQEDSVDGIFSEETAIVKADEEFLNREIERLLEEKK